MSTNLIDKQTGELITLASGTRVWIGTRNAHDIAVSQGKIGNNILVCITDDYPKDDTDWIDGTNCKAKRVGGVVYVQFNKSTSTTVSNVWTTVATIPAQFRVSGATFTEVNFVCIDNERDVPISARLYKSSGEIKVVRNPYSGSSYTTNSITGTFSFAED